MAIRSICIVTIYFAILHNFKHVLELKDCWDTWKLKINITASATKYPKIEDLAPLVVELESSYSKISIESMAQFNRSPYLGVRRTAPDSLKTRPCMPSFDPPRVIPLKAHLLDRCMLFVLFWNSEAVQKRSHVMESDRHVF